MSNISDLENQLQSAPERLRASKDHRAEFRSIYAETLSLERRLAEAKSDEYAVPLDLPVKIDPGAPLPHLIQDDWRAYLIFFVSVPDPNWNGTYVTAQDPKNTSAEPLALVEFHRCVSTRMGHPNDDDQAGHRLYGKGLQHYTAQIVRNSRWIPELAAIREVSSEETPQSRQYWQELTHYVFWFHDCMFECVAKSYKVEVFQESMASLLSRVCNRLLK